MNPNPDHAADSEGDSIPAEAPESTLQPAAKPVRRKRAVKVAVAEGHEMPEAAADVAPGDGMSDEAAASSPSELGAPEGGASVDQASDGDSARKGRRQRRRGPRAEGVDAAGSENEPGESHAEDDADESGESEASVTSGCSCRCGRGVCTGAVG
jgi:hypothetical protein